MIEVKMGTKLAKRMLREVEDWECYCDIWEAYQKPSHDKVDAYCWIRDRAMSKPGYMQNLRIIARTCQSFSTIYSYYDGDDVVIERDTRTETYRLTVPNGRNLGIGY